MLYTDANYAGDVMSVSQLFTNQYRSSHFSSSQIISPCELIRVYSKDVRKTTSGEVFGGMD